MPRPICVACRIEMSPEHNGQLAVLQCVGVPELDYQVWRSDLWKCPMCGHEVIMGFGDKPTHEFGLVDNLQAHIKELEQRDGAAIRYCSSLRERVEILRLSGVGEGIPQTEEPTNHPTN